MCNNYVPAHKQILRDVYGVAPPGDDYPPETWPDYLAPIIIQQDGQRHAAVAGFGMVPKARIPEGVRPFDTTNARAETVGEKRSFSGAWKRQQFCLVPAMSVFEPYYGEQVKSTRYRIGVKDIDSFAVAGLWREWPDGFRSFTMLTVNADDHPVMSRMHAPNKEKRSIVILPPDDWNAWLACDDTDVARSFLRLYPAEAMYAEAAPVSPRGKRHA